MRIQISHSQAPVWSPLSRLCHRVRGWPSTKRCHYQGHQYLNIIQLAIYVGMYVSRVLDSQLLNGWCQGHQNCRVCSRTRSHDSVIFSYFWNSYFSSYGEFGEFITMHCSGVAEVRQCGSAHYKIGDAGFWWHVGSAHSASLAWNLDWPGTVKSLAGC